MVISNKWCLTMYNSMRHQQYLLPNNSTWQLQPPSIIMLVQWKKVPKYCRVFGGRWKTWWNMIHQTHYTAHTPWTLNRSISISLLASESEKIHHFNREYYYCTMYIDACMVSKQSSRLMLVWLVVMRHIVNTTSNSKHHTNLL